MRRVRMGKEAPLSFSNGSPFPFKLKPKMAYYINTHTHVHYFQVL